MNAPAEIRTLPSLVTRAASSLSAAVSSAEILEARDMASVVYDAAKKAARLAKAKGAHDDLIAAAYRAQADALEIESLAKRRLADEYDAAQERGEVATRGKPENVLDGNVKPTAADLGLSRKQIHDARQIRDAEATDPGLIRRTLDDRLAAGQEPTKAAVREAVVYAARLGMQGRAPGGERKGITNPHHNPDPARDAAVQFAANCRDMVDRASRWTPSQIAAAFPAVTRDFSRSDMEEARALITSVLKEMTDA